MSASAPDMDRDNLINSSTQIAPTSREKLYLSTAVQTFSLTSDYSRFHINGFEGLEAIYVGHIREHWHYVLDAKPLSIVVCHGRGRGSRSRRLPPHRIPHSGAMDVENRVR